MINLGVNVSDRITGFSGVATGRASYITGCDQYLVQPKCEKPGDYTEGRWFDEQRLCVNNDESRVFLDNSKGNGAGLAAPVK